MWSVDLAREQSPSLDTLRRFCDVTVSAGYNALGLYLEHRFAYPSAPWAAGAGALTPEMVRTLEREYPSLQFIPLINVLGHVEGFLYTEEGHRFAEERFHGMQGNPADSGFGSFAQQLIDDTIDAFASGIVHIGGDETEQLGKSESSRRAIESYAHLGPGVDGKARLYGSHVGRLAQHVLARGRRPAVWGDILLRHPQALELLPGETIIFDWQYFGSPQRTARVFLDAGFEVVVCPALHTYNATWLHLPQSEENVRQHAEVAARDGLGTCVTTWECGLFGNYETLLPAIAAAGAMLIDARPGEEKEEETDDRERYASLRAAPAFLSAYEQVSPAHRQWAELMGVTLQDAGGLFAFGGIRSSLKARLLLFSNPFLLWLRNRDELLGPAGETAAATVARARDLAPDLPTAIITDFADTALHFVHLAERVRSHYAASDVAAAAAALTEARTLFEALRERAEESHRLYGSSIADVERCRIAAEHIDTVIERVQQYGNGSLGYLPSFETITHPKFVPHDQGNWWLHNRWANE